MDASATHETDTPMRPSRLRTIAILVTLVTLLLTVEVAPASALTLQRQWSAHVATVNGALLVRAYTNGVGSVTYDLKRLRPNTSYTIAIRYGTCSRLGAVATRLPNVRSSATGAVRRTD